MFEYAREVLQGQINFNNIYLNTEGKNTNALAPLNAELQQAIKVLEEAGEGE